MGFRGAWSGAAGPLGAGGRPQAGPGPRGQQGNGERLPALPGPPRPAASWPGTLRAGGAVWGRALPLPSPSWSRERRSGDPGRPRHGHWEGLRHGVRGSSTG